MSNHLLTAPVQPATHFTDRNVDPPLHVRNKPKRLLLCYKCEQLRWAKNLKVQVFYDSVRYWCKDGKGCNRK